MHRSKLTPDGFVEAVRSLHLRVVAMKACSSARHWARLSGDKHRSAASQPAVRLAVRDRNDAPQSSKPPAARR
jgi:hypothetical protein